MGHKDHKDHQILSYIVTFVRFVAERLGVLDIHFSSFVFKRVTSCLNVSPLSA